VIDSELLEIRQAFAIEGAELLADMESSLLALEDNPGAADDFGKLFRTVHTVKGSASIVRFEAIEHFCHSIEHILVRIREKELSLTPELVALLLKCHDHISTMMDAYCADVTGAADIFLPPLHTDLLDQLQEWSDHGHKELPLYGELDESYLGGAGGNGLVFFEDADDTRLRGGVAGDASDDAAAVRDKSTLHQRVVRVDADRIDQLSDLVVELVTAASVMEANVRRLRDLASTESAAHVADLIKQIQEKTMSFRMIPIHTLFQRFHRIVHDIGSSTGKQIRLLISGGETELDKAVAEKLHEPLLHLVRNAIDHGIEKADERSGQGKSPTGSIRLKAFHESGHIILRVEDDGQGINLGNVVQKAVERGLVRPGSMPSDKAVLSLIFEPGFSTRDDATMLSGRGVGMDVVRRTVESLRGRVDVESVEGVGSTFQISIPLSLTLVDGFMVSLGSSLYILPMELVLETMEYPSAERRASMPNGCLQIRDQLLPCLDLRRVLGVVEQAAAGARHVVVLRYGETNVGLVVDKLHGEIKTVIKPLGHLYQNVTVISGAGILGDGSIALFLETGKLIEGARDMMRAPVR
jgi:two-component system chemotaxis sensor kinase CheA